MDTGRSIGIWLDTREAYRVTLTGDTVTEQRIDSGIETRERIEGEGKDSMRMGDQFSVPEQKKRERLETDFKKYFESLKGHIKQTDDLVLFGPGEVPAAFKNHLLSESGWSSSRIDHKKANSMTDPQKTAWVREYFGKPAARKPHPLG